MKRHSSLIPLSRDHHLGLVLAQRLELGKSKAPRAKWPAAPEAQRDLTVLFYERELTPHFQAEELFVFPRAEQFDAGKDNTVASLRADHLRLAQLIETMRKAGGEILKKTLLEFAVLLREHIRREEEILFERLQQALPEAELKECGEEMASYLQKHRSGASCLL
ncbi:MAG: hemerythrin domain-containing protein [Acidobacteria bacterium]|nr:hemerythrin domain-containing protein [Acidobacteriota bacterium]